jgi:hypothetical protein
MVHKVTIREGVDGWARGISVQRNNLSFLGTFIDRKDKNSANNILKPETEL